MKQTICDIGNIFNGIKFKLPTQSNYIMIRLNFKVKTNVQRLQPLPSNENVFDNVVKIKKSIKT